MANFVLVHGAWQNSGTWDLTRQRLEALGHTVVVPSLTGLAPKSLKLDDTVTLSTHVADVVAAVKSSGLQDVVLVAHSYGGMVVTAAAEQLASLIARIVYVDAFVPEDGQCAMDFFPPPFQAAFRQQAQAGGGWKMVGGENLLDLWLLKPGAARDFVKANLCDFSIRCFEERVALPKAAARSLPRAYVACVAEAYGGRHVFGAFLKKLQEAGCPCVEMKTGHDCHVEEPDAFVEHLIRLSSK